MTTGLIGSDPSGWITRARCERVTQLEINLMSCYHPADSNMDIRPNHTVYINNINDKVKKEGQFILRKWFRK
ncbi:hypothetical protein ATANTOWER_030247 [Ataeniobius toweri]|uniref:Uncharacterized protein n=1 Tax=Ataeniobius toweri TaxID=208326 RepID=A0ABU7A9S2_9TELE|nr:hypothetical protein [Ataeniobius toweri]